MNDEPIAFVVGVMFGALIALVAMVVLTSSASFKYDVGWSQLVCVVVGDTSNNYTQQCATGAELAAMLKAKGR